MHRNIQVVICEQIVNVISTGFITVLFTFYPGTGYYHILSYSANLGQLEPKSNHLLRNPIRLVIIQIYLKDTVARLLSCLFLTTYSSAVSYAYC